MLLENFAYRGANKYKCPAGHLIPDRDYNPDWEKLLVRPSYENEVSRYFRHRGFDLQLIAELQGIHDSHHPEKWESRFDIVITKARRNQQKA